jgi:hypothetical protein
MKEKHRNSNRRRGATLVLAALSMVSVGGVAAIVIDLSMLFKARADAQKAAEAGALAGASAFLQYAAADPIATDTANARALRLAESNAILTQMVAPSEVTQPIDVNIDSQLVRVTVRRRAVGTWFARLLGVDSVPIGAHAAARAVRARNGNCVKPFAVPDMWDENSGDDANGNNLEDNGEKWSETGDDSYQAGNPDAPNGGQTGYGSGLRNSNGDYSNDFGRQVSLTLPDPANPTPYLGPNQFKPFLPSGGNDPGDYRDAIEDCDPSQVVLGDSYQLMNNPTGLAQTTADGINSLVNQDPNAHWNSQTETIDDSRFPDWRSSPRTIRIGLFDPRQIGPTQSSVTLNNMGLMFVEGFDTGTNTLTGRMFYFVTGSGNPDEDAGVGTLVKMLRLVE